MSGCCGGNGSVVIEAKQRLGLLQRPKGEPIVSNGTVRVEYAGEQRGAVTYRSVSGQTLTQPYKLGNNALNRYADMPPADAKLFIEAGICKYVKEQSIDLEQVNRVDVAPDTMPDVVPPKTVDLTAVSDMALGDFREAVLGLGADQLQELERLEEAKEQPRKGALRTLSLALADLERVG